MLPEQTISIIEDGDTGYVILTVSEGYMATEYDDGSTNSISIRMPAQDAQGLAGMLNSKAANAIDIKKTVEKLKKSKPAEMKF